MTGTTDAGSFRDPAGFVFRRSGVIYRQVQFIAKSNYDLLMSSGLYNELAEKQMLVPHVECEDIDGLFPNYYRIIKPQRIPFISYPHEWCFSQLKDAALLTLNIQKMAIAYGQTLKDASAYNIQFLNGKPIHIDTLSFEKYESGSPWAAYRQFCQHFLGPLALMSRVDVRLSQLFRVYLDGIPLDLVSILLPTATKFKFGLLTHIHLHSKSQKKYEKTTDSPVNHRPLPANAMLGLIDSLESTILGLTWTPAGTEWGDYYEGTNYSNRAMDGKITIVNDFIDRVDPKPSSLWDIGANRGVFSRLASSRGISTVAWDIDPVAVEKNYIELRAKNQLSLLPLLQDLTNPSPNMGWSLEERKSMLARGPADVVLALALIHHMCIGNNVPLTMVAEFCLQSGKWLIIEFVPKTDSQVALLLATREDIFPDYTVTGFETAFSKYFEIIHKQNVQESERFIYLMKGR